MKAVTQALTKVRDIINQIIEEGEDGVIPENRIAVGSIVKSLAQFECMCDDYVGYSCGCNSRSSLAEEALEELGLARQPIQGWTRINTVADLPQVAGTYTVMNKDGDIETWHYNGIGSSSSFWLEYFTHWRPVIEQEKPML